MISPVKAYIRDLDSFFYSGNNWQPSLLELLKEITAKDASWRPAKGRNNIYELLMHSNFWKKAVICHLRENPMSREQLKKGNWIRTKKQVTSEQWNDCLAETETVHEELKAEILRHGKKLHDISSDVSNYSREVICHEAYHAGQIGIIRAMLGHKTII